MVADPGEQNNMYPSKPDLADRLLAQLTEYVNGGSSVDGKSSSNDVKNIVLWKGEKKK